jgi:glycosyltransferase involved in cell wall biosynthesis
MNAEPGNLRATVRGTIRGTASPTLSVVIPIHNEFEVLPKLRQRLEAVLRREALTYEIIFVDDGSTDDGPLLVRQWTANDGAIRLLQLTRNFGKEAAVTAGLDNCHGEAVIVMDADLQDPPECIPAMLEQWRAGYEVVAMRRRSRSADSRFKRLCAKGYYWLLERASPTPIPRNVGDFRLLDRQAVLALGELPERNRYMKGLFAWVGMRGVTLEYDRPGRDYGNSSWGFLQLCGLAVDGLTSFSVAPLRLVTLVGLLTAGSGFGFGAFIVIKEILLGDPVAGYPSLIAGITFIGGVQLLSVGLLGEYVGKIYLEVKQRPVYLLRSPGRTQTSGASRDADTARARAAGKLSNVS